MTKLVPLVGLCFLFAAASLPAATPAAGANPNVSTTSPPVAAPFARVVWVDDERALTLTGPAGKAIAAKIGAELPSGSQVRTGKTGAELQLSPSGSVIRLAANTTFRLSSLAGPDKSGDNQLELVSGKLRMFAVPIATGQAGYELRTGSAVAGVRGTDFAREYDPAKKTDWLCVIHGLIDFASLDEKHDVLVGGGDFVNLNKGWQAVPAPQAWLDANLADINGFKTAIGENK